MTATTKKTPDQDAYDIRLINYKLDDIKKDVTDIKGNLRADYVTQDQFDPIRRLVYGTVTLILTAFIVAVAGFVLRNN